MSSSRRSSGSGRTTIWKSWFDCTNPKAAAGRSFNVLNGIHYMSPANSAGYGNLCPWAARCVKPCLVSSGKGGAPNVIEGRRRRSKLYFEIGPEAYGLIHVKAALSDGKIGTSLVDRARQMGLKPALRMNGTSDVPWWKYGIPQEISRGGVTCYEYSKNWEGVLDWLSKAPDFRGYKYHLTMSLGGTLDKDTANASRTYQEILDNGGNVAAVWASREQAEEQVKTGIDSFLVSGQDGSIVQRIDLGGKRRVIDGNELNGDLRFRDPKGVIVGLYAKGRTEKLDRGAKRFFLHNPEDDEYAAVVTGGLPMGAIRQEGQIIHIDAEERGSRWTRS